MPLTFPDELAIGVQEIDDQHRAFYRSLNVLHAAMRAGELAEATRIVDFLVTYARDHFALEERLMIDAAYTGLPEHVAQHRAFTKDLWAWHARFAAKGPTPSLIVDLSAWLTGWLGDHIRKVDAPMAQLLRTPQPKR